MFKDLWKGPEKAYIYAGLGDFTSSMSEHSKKAEERDKLMMEQGGHEYRKQGGELMYEFTKKGIPDSELFESIHMATCEAPSGSFVSNARTLGKLAAIMANIGEL